MMACGLKKREANTEILSEMPLRMTAAEGGIMAETLSAGLAAFWVEDAE
jgi:hypothetical protein